MSISCGHKTPNLDVEALAAHLEGLEETIISRLIERAQFCHNERSYRPGESGFRGAGDQSLFQVRLQYQETMDAQFGRFCVPEERPFFNRLPRPKRTVTIPETGLRMPDLNTVNLTPEILDTYLALVPQICRPGDDGQYGSSAEHDVHAVQAIARRVHYGSLYVAESKFRSAPDAFEKLVKAGDMDAIIQKLTRKEVEERILRRVPEKVAAAQLNANPRVRHLIDPEIIVAFYRETIMPLTKKGQALYLMRRTG
jgi:chorismate mutase